MQDHRTQLTEFLKENRRSPGYAKLKAAVDVYRKLLKHNAFNKDFLNRYREPEWFTQKVIETLDDIYMVNWRNPKFKTLHNREPKTIIAAIIQIIYKASKGYQMSYGIIAGILRINEASVSITTRKAIELLGFNF